MQLRITKMHGAGNDFVVIDAIRQAFSPTPALCRFIADRHFGIGCDQILVVEPAPGPDADFRYRIFNADGGEVEQCGNGARCFARFVWDQGLTTARAMRVQTLGGLIVPVLELDGRVTVDMGPARFEPESLPFDVGGLVVTPGHARPSWTLPLANGEEVALCAVSMGNPHVVQCVADVDHAPVAVQGPLIEGHPRFARRVNAGFLQVLDPHHARLRVWERGAGETLSCGTGACAAALAGIELGQLVSPVTVATRGGELVIAWGGGQSSVHLTGPAQTVFSAELTVPPQYTLLQPPPPAT